MEKMKLFTVNIIDVKEDPEWAGSYNTSVSPTNRVFASFEDASMFAFGKTVTTAKDIYEIETDAEDRIECITNGYTIKAPWDVNEETSFVVCELIWEEWLYGKD